MGSPATLKSLFKPTPAPTSAPFLSAQWLESIEVMKSALQQKMLDLESEKVNVWDLNSPQL